MNHSVLVTGSSGRIGRAVVAELQRRGHRVRGFDRVPFSGLADTFLGDLSDRALLDQAMTGINCLIHLAATPDDADFLEELVPNNLVGVYHVLESARAAGLSRAVLASSGQANWWQQTRGPLPIRASDPVSPRYWYAATKMFLEAIGYGFAETHGMSVITARLGWCPRDAGQVAEIRASERFQDVYLSPADAGRFFAGCVEAPTHLRHAVVYATSKPRRQAIFDLEAARTLVGYEPQESWPMGIDDQK
ncbi:MAG TPA: NAD(P)-dependent oxidoreductase [Verrucomicrobiota bacterium]|nr:NAD(P)-dependent oxidoreductase [Verrucomicrobiota bacterium]